VSSLSQVSQALGVRRRQVRLMTPDECQARLGFARGAVPPIGHR
jgi:prolyl-tRNA editing enzyme YbaK/EbsC (Cys-tRNA(Pro) deacylase)